MQDTIDTLETIGQDASLRYAPSEELAASSALADASEALMTAIRESDSSRLGTEFGSRVMQPVQGNLSPGREEEPDEEEGDEPNPRGPSEPGSI